MKVGKNWKKFWNVLGIIGLIVLVGFGAWSRSDSDNKRNERFYEKYKDDPVGLFIDKCRLDYDSLTRKQIIDYIEDKDKYRVCYDTVINGNRIQVEMKPYMKIDPDISIKKLKRFPNY